MSMAFLSTPGTEWLYERLAQTTSASGTGRARAIETRCRALLSQGEAADALYRQAIGELAPTVLRFDIARTHLPYGEWLRQEWRHIAARKQLRVAHDLFSQFGMEGFADRAQVELRATGEHAWKRTVENSNDLTPQEAQISRRVGQGATNRQIAAQLFISATTVEYHLHRVFASSESSRGQNWHSGWLALGRDSEALVGRICRPRRVVGTRSPAFARR